MATLRLGVRLGGQTRQIEHLGEIRVPVCLPVQEVGAVDDRDSLTGEPQALIVLPLSRQHEGLCPSPAELGERVPLAAELGRTARVVVRVVESAQRESTRARLAYAVERKP